jgi:hypothetical protein
LCRARLDDRFEAASSLSTTPPSSDPQVPTAHERRFDCEALTALSGDGFTDA